MCTRLKGCIIECGNNPSGYLEAWLATLGYPAGDFDEDSDVDFFDFAVIGAAWGSTPSDANWNPICDISHPKDNVIDYFDLDVFCDNWLAGAE